MKKFALPVLFLLGSLPAWADVKPAPSVGTPITISENLTLNTGIERVLQIRAMDKNTLGPEEREDLKQELRLIENDLLATKQKTAVNGTGVYISVGGIILILLLLLILL